MISKNACTSPETALLVVVVVKVPSVSTTARIDKLKVWLDWL